MLGVFYFFVTKPGSRAGLGKKGGSLPSCIIGRSLDFAVFFFIFFFSIQPTVIFAI